MRGAIPKDGAVIEHESVFDHNRLSAIAAGRVTNRSQ